MRRAIGSAMVVIGIFLFIAGCNTNEAPVERNTPSTAPSGTPVSTQASSEITPQSDSTESLQEDSLEFVVNGENIQLDTISILSDSVTLLIPTSFNIMSEDMAKIKYPMENRPTLIYTNDTGSINIAFQYTQSQASSSDIQEITDALKANFEHLYPSAQWYTSEVKRINDKDIGVLELLTPAVDTEIFNLMWFTDLDGKLLIATFNCTESQMDDWKPIGEAILSSFTLI
jgi:hypothetical protein